MRGSVRWCETIPPNTPPTHELTHHHSPWSHSFPLPHPPSFPCLPSLHNGESSPPKPSVSPSDSLWLEASVRKEQSPGSPSRLRWKVSSWDCFPGTSRGHACLYLNQACGAIGGGPRAIRLKDLCQPLNSGTSLPGFQLQWKPLARQKVCLWTLELFKIARISPLGLPPLPILTPLAMWPLQPSSEPLLWPPSSYWSLFFCLTFHILIF